MKLLFRHTVLILLMWLMVAGVCYGKQVYLQDGGIIDAQSAWRQGGKVFVKVNRDIVAEFNPNEIDLRRTFPGSALPSRHLKRIVSAADKSTEAKPSAAAVASPKPALQATPPVSPPAPRPAAPPVPATPPMSKEPAQPVATDPASPPAPDKAELQQRAQEAAKMMTEAVMKKDPELIKKALEMQKSAMQQGAAGQKRSGFPLFLILIILAVSILIIAAQWIVFQKAGQAGWKCLIPFYNIYILMKISGKPGWWMFLLIIPLVGVAIYLFAMLSLAKKFGRGELFGVGIFFLPMIFFPLLAFGGSEYEG